MYEFVRNLVVILIVARNRRFSFYILRAYSKFFLFIKIFYDSSTVFPSNIKLDDWSTRDGDFLFTLRLDKDVGFIGNKCTCNVVSGTPVERMNLMEKIMHEETTPCVDVRDLVEWKAFIASHERCAEAYYPDVRLPASTQQSYYDEAMVCNRLARALHKALHNRGEQCFTQYETTAKEREAATQLSGSEVNIDSFYVSYSEFFIQMQVFELFGVLGLLYLVQVFTWLLLCCWGHFRQSL